MQLNGVTSSGQLTIHYIDYNGNEMATEDIGNRNTISKLFQQFKVSGSLSSDFNNLIKGFDTDLENEDHPLHDKYKKLKKQDIAVNEIYFNVTKSYYELVYSIDENTKYAVKYNMNGTKSTTKLISK